MRFKDWLFESTLHSFTCYVSEENIDIPLPIFLLKFRLWNSITAYCNTSNRLFLPYLYPRQTNYIDGTLFNEQARTCLLKIRSRKKYDKEFYPYFPTRYSRTNEYILYEGKMGYHRWSFLFRQYNPCHREKVCFAWTRAIPSTLLSQLGTGDIFYPAGAQLATPFLLRGRQILFETIPRYSRRAASGDPLNFVISA